LSTVELSHAIAVRLKIVRHIRGDTAPRSVYDDQIAGHSQNHHSFRGPKSRVTPAFQSGLRGVDQWIGAAVRKFSGEIVNVFMPVRAGHAATNDSPVIVTSSRPVGAVNDPRLFHAERASADATPLKERMIPHAHKLKGRTRRISLGTQQMNVCMHAKSRALPRHRAVSTMEKWRKDEQIPCSLRQRSTISGGRRC